MCGRFTQRTNLSVLAEVFGARILPGLELKPRFNIAPTTQVPIVRMVNGEREISTQRWGLIPFWAKDTKVGFSGINARAETLGEKPMFREAYKKRRCLVLADGYYEWIAESPKKKLPIYYTIDGGKPFAFAGIWETWRGPHKKGEPLESCCIITTAANELAREVHDRMPAILDPVDFDQWLDVSQQDVGKLLDPFPASRMTVTAANPYVNKAGNEGPECLEPPKDLS